MIKEIINPDRTTLILNIKYDDNHNTNVGANNGANVGANQEFGVNKRNIITMALGKERMGCCKISKH